MKCKDIREMLFAYIDGDISDIEKQAIEEHLEVCPDCTTALEECRESGEKLLLLRESPAMPPITPESITGKNRSRRFFFLRPAVIAVPVIIILAIFLSLQFTGFSGSASEVIAKACETTNGLASFRSEHFEHQKGTTPYILQALTEYSAPDRFHVTLDIELIIPGYITGSREYYSEYIGVADTGYVLDQVGGFTPDEEWFRRSIPSQEKTLELANLLIDIESLDDEIIDGETCYHYFGLVDMYKYIEQRKPGWEKSYLQEKEKMESLGFDYMEIDTYIESRIEGLGPEMTLELWIGKSDYLIRKEISTLDDSSVSEVRFFDFNKEIIIEPPADESGELLEGWVAFDVISIEVPETS